MSVSRRSSVVISSAGHGPHGPGEESLAAPTTASSLIIDGRPASRLIDRPPSLHGSDEAATVELASIVAMATSTSSNPVSPGPSSPPLADPARAQDFVPPARPSSTPFPQPEPRNDEITCASCPAAVAGEDGVATFDGFGLSPFTTLSQPPAVSLNDLPPEIHECILDHLFGYRVSATSKSSVGMTCVTRSWGTALRHSRRRELSELALVSGVWRCLIQERLYRHIKLKATVRSVTESIKYFASHPHLRPYVKHIEIWFPVFQPKIGSSVLFATSVLPTVTIDGLTAASYVLPADNCSLEEAFYFVSTTFPGVTVLTLEGGERKKAPKVRHFVNDGSNGGEGPSRQTQAAALGVSRLFTPQVAETSGQLAAAAARKIPKAPSVTTLVTKGQWNLLRTEEDFEVIMTALPNLQEWHGSYNKPKSKSYLSMASVLPKLAAGISKLHLCLEADYRRELSFPPFWLKVQSKVHFCPRLGHAAVGLEHISYTGRICRGFFDALIARSDPRQTRLKSIDLTVKNCCRQVAHWNESGSGIADMNFIYAFEALVIAGIRSLKKLRAVEYLRIRYVDLESPIPALNPFFVVRRDNWVEGVWSDNIVRALQASRPEAQFRELSENPGLVGFHKDGRVLISPDAVGKVTSFKLDNFKFIAGGGHIPPPLSAQ